LHAAVAEVFVYLIIVWCVSGSVLASGGDGTMYLCSFLFNINIDTYSGSSGIWYA